MHARKSYFDFIFLSTWHLGSADNPTATTLKNDPSRNIIYIVRIHANRAEKVSTRSR